MWLLILTWSCICLALPPSSAPAQNPTGSQPKTLGSMIGELALKELEWLLMPTVVLGQYKIFKTSKAAEVKFKAKGLIKQPGGTLWLGTRKKYIIQ